MSIRRTDRAVFRLTVAGALACLAAWILLVPLGVAGEAVRLHGSNVGEALAALAAAATCAVAVRRGVARPRRAWLLIGAACLMWGLGQVTWTVYELLGLQPFPSLADLGYIWFAPLIAAGLLALEAGAQSRAARLRSVFDGLIIGVSLLLVGWLTLLGRIATDGDGGLPTVLSMAYPVGDIVVFTIAGYVVMRRRLLTGMVSRRLTLLITGIVAFAAADIAFAYLSASETYVSGNPTDTGWFTGLLMIAVAAVLPAPRTPRPPHAEDPRRPLGILLPYLAVVFAAVPATVQVVSGARHHEFSGMVLAVLIGVISIRQLMTLAENTWLLGHLEQRVAERTAELSARERRFKRLVERSSDIVAILDRQGLITYVSDSLHPVFGYRPEEVIGRPLIGFATRDGLDQLHAALFRVTVGTLGDTTIEVPLHHRSGAVRQVAITLSNLLGDPSVEGIVVNARDVSEQRLLEERLTHEASHDVLTGLPNRAFFVDRLEAALEGIDADRGVAVLFLDLDGFKMVNDTLGHAAGDRVLIQVATRLQSCVRGDDTVARLGGDEFAVLVEGPAADQLAVTVAQRIAEVLGRPATDGAPECPLGSVGIAVAVPGEGVEQLLRNADVAMYRAKAAGDGGHALYDPEMHTALLERVRLEGHLKAALDGGELLLHYQPTVDLETGRVTGFEALIRWEHPEQGLLPPSVFIPVAEEMGLIADIGAWALKEACRDLASWRATVPGAADITVAVNVSAGQLRPRILDEVVSALEENGLPPRALTLEMTESMLIDRSEGILSMLAGLRRLGVRLAIDDFGTGYSSLSYLRRFPVSVLKIDRSFVENLVDTPEDAEFVATIVQLGRNLGMTTIAEGIEHEEQLAPLRGAGCDLGQGYVFSPPVPADRVPDLVGTRFDAVHVAAAPAG